MIVLDTNVLSEMMRKEPSAAVVAWYERHAPRDLFTTAICEAEIWVGLRAAADEARRAALLTGARRMFRLMMGKVLPFDEAAAEHYADMVLVRRGTGRPIEPPDAQIAAIARANGMAVATRNVRDFGGCGIALIDPWAA